jgi:uncharacterized low-complexity protein
MPVTTLNETVGERTMIEKKNMKPLTVALGTAVTATLASIPAVQAVENPFSMSKLSGGYMVAAEDSGNGMKEMEGKCGEGKCGSNAKKAKSAEGKCGTKTKEKAKEGKCGAKSAPAKTEEGKCGGNK